MDPNYAPVPAARYLAFQDALRLAPQVDGRFDGSPMRQRVLADQMRALFDPRTGFAPSDSEEIRLKRDDTLGLANDLQHAEPNWSIGQYSAALATLIEPEGDSA